MARQIKLLDGVYMTDVICKICNSVMSDFICRGCRHYAHHQNNDDASEYVKVCSFLVSDDGYYLFVRGGIARIRNISGIVLKEFGMPELTSELAKEWLEKLKLYQVLS